MTVCRVEGGIDGESHRLVENAELHGHLRRATTPVDIC
jgi:hypothetical protein